jgi:pentatricopeptide repeat protein
MRLMEEMQNEGIAPSNFTLSIMVKLLNRARRVEDAFQLVEDLPKKYRFKPNSHVFTNLIQGCISNRQPSRALMVLETMVKERVQPDGKTYAILIRSSMYQNEMEQADALFRAALGLPGAYVIPGLSLATSYDYKFVNETLTHFVDRGCAQKLASPLVADISKQKLKVNIDQGVLRRITSSSRDESASSNFRTSAKGKGRATRSSW